MNLLYAVLLLMLVVTGVYMFTYYTGDMYKKKKNALLKNKNVYKMRRKANWEDFIDFFWLSSFKFWWISLFLFFGFLLGLALQTEGGYILSFISLTFLSLFLYWANNNYQRFPKIAKERLDKFENEVRAGLKDIPKENIFELPVGEKKFTLPKILPHAKKVAFVVERKLEFIVIFKGYFQICDKAPKFNLFNHRGDAKANFAHKKGGLGACRRYYFLRMKDISHDGKNLKFTYDNKDEVVFPCKKGPSYKALENELHKIESKKYEKVMG